MTVHVPLLLRIASLSLFVSGVVMAQANLRSPSEVHAALTTLNRVVNHTQRLITARNYTRLPRENDEFKEGVEGLEKGIAKEPADFKAKIETLISRASAGSQGVADAAAEHDDTRLAATHATFADAVKVLLDAFPPEVKPSSPSVMKQ